MIRFTVEDIPEIYRTFLGVRNEREMLKAGAKLLSELGHKGIDTLLEGKTSDFKIFNLGKIGTLPVPLRTIEAYFYSNGLSYMSNTQIFVGTIVSTKPGAEKVCRNIANKLKSGENVIDSNESLLFLGITNIPLFSLSCAPSNHYLMFKFGCGGTSRRKLNSLEQFKTDMENYGKLLTEIVNATYDELQIPEVNYVMGLEPEI